MSLFSNRKLRTKSSCFYVNETIVDSPCYVRASKLNATIGVGVTIMILVSISLAQHSSALKPIVFFTSVGTDDEQLKYGAIITVPNGQNTVNVNFKYFGLDDNDHIEELRCSFDGINYLKSNCDNQTQEFRGPVSLEGGISNYYYRNGTTSHDFPVGPILKSHVFGIKALNDNNELSMAATWTVKIRPSTNVVPSEGLPVSKPEKYQVDVQFNSIKVHNDHDGIGRGAGDFVNYAYVQGNRVILNMHVDSGQTVQFNPTKHTVLLEENIPLSIFTVGNEEDCNVSLASIHPPEYLTDLGQIFKDPNLDWSQAVSQAQSKIFDEYLGCKGDRLGTINEMYSPPNYEAGLHEVKSSNGDFTLRYTIYVSPAPQ